VLVFKEYIQKDDLKAKEGSDKGECLDNAELAYSHIEDAIMRLGKVIEADNVGDK
jgi:hypothetical protein